MKPLSEAQRKVLQLATERGGMFTFWPRGLFRHRVLNRCVNLGLINSNSPAEVCAVEFAITPAGRAALERRDG